MATTFEFWPSTAGKEPKPSKNKVYERPVPQGMAHVSHTYNPHPFKGRMDADREEDPLRARVNYHFKNKNTLGADQNHRNVLRCGETGLNKCARC